MGSGLAESVFDRYQRRESELNEVVKQDRARHDATVKNYAAPGVPRDRRMDLPQLGRGQILFLAS
jgi:hypothetical protein